MVEIQKRFVDNQLLSVRVGQEEKKLGGQPGKVSSMVADNPNYL
jgi:hypothetical protein